MSVNKTYVSILASMLLYRLIMYAIKTTFDFHCKKEKCCCCCCGEDCKKNYIKIKEQIKKIKSENNFALIIILYIFAKIIRLIPDSIIFWILMNLCMLYKPLKKKFPQIDIGYFFTCIRQTYEGIFDLITAFIPKYSEENKKNKVL